MFNLERDYIYESERRKDEMREAAKSQLFRELPKTPKSPARLLAILGILIWLLITFIR